MNLVQNVVMVEVQGQIFGTSYLSHREDHNFFYKSMKLCSGSRVGVSRSFLKNSWKHLNTIVIQILLRGLLKLLSIKISRWNLQIWVSGSNYPYDWGRIFGKFEMVLIKIIIWWTCPFAHLPPVLFLEVVVLMLFWNRVSECLDNQVQLYKWIFIVFLSELSSWLGRG